MSLLMKALKSSEQKQAGIASAGKGTSREFELEALDSQDRESWSGKGPSSYARAAAGLMMERVSGGSGNRTFLLLGLLALVIIGLGAYFYLAVNHPALFMQATQKASRPAIAPAPEPLPEEPPAGEPAQSPEKPDKVFNQETRPPETPGATPAPEPSGTVSMAAPQTDNSITVTKGGGTPAVNPYLAHAYQWFQSGEMDKASQAYNRVLQSDPRNIDALLGLAAIHLDRGEMDQAGAQYLKVLDLSPHNAYAEAGLIALVGRHDPAAAESRLKNLIAQKPGAFLYFTLGNVYSDQGRWGDAQQAYFDAVRLEPGSADYAFNLAVSLEHLNQPKPALDYYQRAVLLAQANPGGIHFDLNQAKARISKLQRPAE
jgi:tetratricopeptide (TPR) repeat protein